MPDRFTLLRDRLRNMLVEAAVKGSSQGVLSADLRRRFDAGLDAIEAEARRPALDVLLLAVEEVDNCWTDEGDHIEWDADALPERLIALRREYAALDAAREETLAQQLNHAISESIATTPPRKKRKP